MIKSENLMRMDAPCNDIIPFFSPCLINYSNHSDTKSSVPCDDQTLADLQQDRDFVMVDQSVELDIVQDFRQLPTMVQTEIELEIKAVVDKALKAFVQEHCQKLQTGFPTVKYIKLAGVISAFAYSGPLAALVTEILSSLALSAYAVNRSKHVFEYFPKEAIATDALLRKIGEHQLKIARQTFSEFNAEIPEDLGQLKKTFAQLSLRYHPDKNRIDPQTNLKFQKIHSAYEAFKKYGELQNKEE